MEEDVRNTMFCFGMFLVVLPMLSSQSVDATNQHHKVAYFNETRGSSATLSSVLNLKGHIAFSFRTCSYGYLLQQHGAPRAVGEQRDTLGLSLTPNGSLEMSWIYQDQQDSAIIGNDSLRNNQWYTVDIRFATGEIYLTVKQGEEERFRTLVSNSTYRHYLWELDLSGGSMLQVGVGGFSGCIQEGPSVLLSAADTDAEGVLWDECPLESHTVEGCDAPKYNPCWRYPCLNGGSCVSLGDTYQCNCPLPYSGALCENDLVEQGCALEPCQNEGTCHDLSEGTRRYRCSCPPGYAGVHCEINIDECASSPCQNGGSCTDLIQNYTCDCANTGYHGDQCQRNIDECIELDPCLNGGTCSDAPGSYICQCPSGFSGDNCQLETDDCVSSPCQNGGTCTNLQGAYTCACALGYEGDNCQDNIDDCVDAICDVENSECVDGVNGYKCLCKAGYWDPSNSSDDASACNEILECSSSPCQNSGSCQDLNNFYECECVAGYTGRNCEMEINECAEQPCQNGAECEDLLNAFHCQCVDGYTGTTCDVNINECDTQRCLNGATCNDLVASFNCTCAAGWTGEYCSEQINECASNPCRNGGTCHDGQALFTCDCVLGYEGERCEININDCETGPCQNEATCLDGVNQYTCQCTEAWMGDVCDQVYDACSFEPCLNGATCSSEVGQRDFTCDCLSGFVGNSCETNVDNCPGHNCLDFQICVDGVNEYTCQCPIGYTGETCEVEIDECAGDPCQNGGTCTDYVGYYECECFGQDVNLTRYTQDPDSYYRVGFAGKDCEIEVQECDLQPPICLHGGECKAAEIEDRSTDYGFRCLCDQSDGNFFIGLYCEYRKGFCDLPNTPRCQNGGTCQVVDAMDYYCQCVPGFTGGDCEVNIDECESSPCQENGTCHDGIDGYVCQCLEGLTGLNCETNIDECFSQPCLNEGDCIDKINRYECNCTDTGFTGVECNINIDECLSQPCQNGASCNDEVKGYTCSCFPGYTSEHCETDIDECASDPCLNGATCLQLSDSTREDFRYDAAEGYECQCVPGYEGVHCETDIDECASSPCAHGTCLNLLNHFECECEPGWKGTRCNTEIDECLLHLPCQNNAECVDKLADYHCICIDSPEGVQYGGKNCTVELLGCGDQKCINNATCLPYLQDEASAVHNYTCDCQPGYTGFFCGEETTAQYSGNSWLRYAESSTGDGEFSVSLEFRTTLPSVLLVLNANANDDGLDYISLELINGTTVKLVYRNTRAHQTVELQTSDVLPLNDGKWRKVESRIDYDGLVVMLHDLDCPGGLWQKTATLESSETIPLLHPIGDTYVGGAEAGIADLVEFTPYTGCMRDVVIKGDAIVPASYADSSVAVELGCPRQEQCIPDPCNGHGDCRDLWIDWECDCQRPYFGDSCLKFHKAGTFSHQGANSFARFSVPADQRAELQWDLDLSLFFRTREPQGVLFYVGGTKSLEVEEMQTFIATQIQASGLQVIVKLGPETERFNVNGDFSDGKQHYFGLVRSHADLRVSVDSVETAFTIQGEYPLNPELVYFGGVSRGAGRRRRQAVEEEDESLGEPLFEGPSFKGTLQDMRQNGHILPLFPTNDTEAGVPVYAEPELQGVVEGEVSDDVCSLQEPCMNNGTCSNEFFNDFSCECTKDYRGKNCSLRAFCINAECPTDSTCVDLLDGHECVAMATFQSSGYLQYHNTLDSSPTTIKLRLRSRQQTGTLFHARGSTTKSNNYLTIEIMDEDLLVKYDLGVSGEARVKGVADGEWRDVTVEVKDNGVTADFVGSTTGSSKTVQSMTLGDLLFNSDNVYLAGVSASYRQNFGGMFESSDNFKGCMEDVRVGSVLLPFFHQSKIGESKSAEQFKVEHLEGVEVGGCRSDPVCQSHDCENGATCWDVWNAYECLCVPGYNGTLCEVNIDDCVGHQCENGATCQDGLQEYSCDCVLGYTGDRCETDINECKPDPCLNNGTCWDRVGEYVCNCSANYTGVDCEILITETCEFEPCLNNATCIPVNNTEAGYVTFNCTCLPGYTGRYCESEIDYCEEDPCLNNATCISDVQTLDFICDCVLGYTGRNCETEINECDSKPCQNDAECYDEIGDFLCVCDDGWEGPTCAQDIAECNQTTINGSAPCENGVCVEQPGSYDCNCTGTGYEGERCETDINECDDEDFCQNGGDCENLPGNYICNCTLGYEGLNCEIPDCDSIECENNGTCQITPELTWECSCLEFYEGEFCEVPGPCLEDPCLFGNCTQDVVSEEDANYTCECNTGWEGYDCSEDIDECEADDPCVNGNCTNTDGSYNCSCDPGFTGVNCDVNIDECAGSPCVHGTCVDLINGYNCLCEEGWTGTNCEVDIDECLTNPCENGGSCHNLEPLYTCDCADGYIGNTCHSEDPCLEEDICQHGGNCSSEANDIHRNASVNCWCTEEYTGTYCQTLEPRVGQASDDDLIPLIAGCAVGGLILIIIIVVIALILIARNKRATRGAYSPSRQEMSGSRVEMANQLKVPPEERLI